MAPRPLLETVASRLLSHRWNSEDDPNWRDIHHERGTLRALVNKMPTDDREYVMEVVQNNYGPGSWREDLLSPCSVATAINKLVSKQ